MKKNKEKQSQKMIKVSELRINPDNPRTITKENVDKLKKSISELPKLMELRPIVADMSKDGLVLGGNQRLQAIKLLGMTEIPETWVIDASHLTDDEKQKFIIADNASFGDWDWDILANQWDENLLKDFGLDVPSFDFSNKNKEIDTSGFSEKMEIKLSYSHDEYFVVVKGLSEIAQTPEAAIWKLLGNE